MSDIIPFSKAHSNSISMIKSDDGNNCFAALNRNLMPIMDVKVGSKVVKMPQLDIDHVVKLEKREDCRHINVNHGSADQTEEFPSDLPVTGKQTT